MLKSRSPVICQTWVEPGPASDGIYSPTSLVALGRPRGRGGGQWGRSVAVKPSGSAW